MRVVLKIVKKALPSVSAYFVIFFALIVIMSFFSGKDQEKMYQVTALTIYAEDQVGSTLSKALLSMAVSSLGSVTDTSFLQPSNTPLSICVTPLGITISVRALQ